jgi:predicted DNA-binding transcriptional regulator AlpA
MADNDRTTAMADERPPIWVASISHSLGQIRRQLDAMTKAATVRETSNTATPDQVLKTRELSKKYRIGRGAIYRDAKLGKLRAVRRGKGRSGWTFSESEFRRWLRSR